MSDLVEFLRARLDEDEAKARHAIDGDLDYLPTVKCKCGRGFYIGGDALRVLREVEAKREVVDGALGCYEAAERDGDDFQRGIAVGHTIALRCLAAIYADHPDYRDEWE